MSIKSFTGEYSVLSNFAPTPVTYRGLTFPSVEHAYQAAKTTDLEQRRIIANLKTAAKAKRYGRTLDLRPDWEQVKVPIMKALLRQKFSNSGDSALIDARRVLLETGDEHLEEGNTWGDNFWGTVDGIGLNMLGKLLMEVRNEIKQETDG